MKNNLNFTNLNYSKIEKLNNLISSNINNLESNNKDNKNLDISVNSLINYGNNLSNISNKINNNSHVTRAGCASSILTSKKVALVRELIELNNLEVNFNNEDKALSFFKNYPKLQNFNDLAILKKGIESLKLNRVSRYMKTITNFYPEIAINQEIVYNFIGTAKKYSISNIYSIIESCFNPMNSLISKPIFKFYSNKVVIFLFFYLVPAKTAKLKVKNFLAFAPAAGQGEVNQKRLEFICEILSKIFNKPIVLELTRLHYPFSDSNILANTLGPISDLNPFIKIRRRLLKRAKIINPSNVKNRFIKKSIFGLLSSSPSFLSGIKIRINGRLLIQKVIPRKTMYNFQTGSLARAKANFVQTSRFTNKNKRGAYSITVSIGHGIK
jgi:hypothetical protein